MPNTDTPRQLPSPTLHTRRGSKPKHDNQAAQSPSLFTPPILPSFWVIEPSQTLQPPMLPPVRDLLAFLGKAVLLMLLAAASYNVLPTPSPELDPASLAQDFFGTHGPPTWETLRSGHSVSAGTKRSHDYAMEDFFTDMKKRRLAPSYDPGESSCRPYL